MANGSNVTYEPSALVRSFHNAPHYDLDFRAISHKFAPGETRYQQALAQIAWPLPAVVIIFCLWRIFLLCCCRKKESRSLSTPRDLTCPRLVVYLLAICATAGIAVSFKANADLNDGADSLRSRTSKAGVILSGMVSAAGTAGNASLALSATVSSTDWTAYSSSVQDQAATMAAELGASGQQLHGIAGAGRLYDPTQFNDDVKDVNQRRSVATIAFTAFVLVLLAVDVFSVLIKSPFALQVSRLLGHVCFFILGVLAGLELALSVGVADFCYDPGTYIAEQANNPQIAGFYLLCDPRLPSPYASAFSEASAGISSSRSLIQQIEQETGDSFPAIVNGTAQLEAALAGLQVQLGCEPLHEQLIYGINTACTTGFGGAVTLLFSHATAAFFFAIILLLLSHLSRHTEADAYLYVGDAFGESTPLVHSRESRVY